MTPEEKRELILESLPNDTAKERPEICEAFGSRLHAMIRIREINCFDRPWSSLSEAERFLVGDAAYLFVGMLDEMKVRIDEDKKPDLVINISNAIENIKTLAAAIKDAGIDPADVVKFAAAAGK